MAKAPPRDLRSCLLSLGHTPGAPPFASCPTKIRYLHAYMRTIKTNENKRKHAVREGYRSIRREEEKKNFSLISFVCFASLQLCVYKLDLLLFYFIIYARDELEKSL